MYSTARTPDEVVDLHNNPPCWECGGVGLVEETDSHYSSREDQYYPDTYERPCPKCGGSGHQMDTWEVWQGRD